MHQCTTLTFQKGPELVRRILLSFLTEVKPALEEEGWWVLEGLPAEFALAILTIALGNEWAALTRIRRTRCR